MTGPRDIFYIIAPFGVLLFIWQATVILELVDTTLLPSPIELIKTFTRLTENNLILRHIGYSFYRLSIGLSLGMVMGIIMGIMIGSNLFVRQLLSPLFSILITIPTIALVPILLITLGIGNSTVIISIFLASFFPVTYGTIAGVRGIDKRYIQAAMMAGANRSKIFKNILIPGSLMSLIPGLRLAIGYSWATLVGSEMLATNDWGLGFMIYAARTFFAVDVMFLGLSLIAILGLLMDRVIVSIIEKRTIRKWGYDG